MAKMYNEFKELVDNAKSIVIIQPENLDGDSIGSAIGLEAIFEEMGKKVSLFSVTSVPKYLRYIRGWDRIDSQWTGSYDLAIIVDTMAETLLEKTLKLPGVRHFLDSHPTIVLDHHGSEDEPETDSLTFRHQSIVSPTAAATGELIHAIATSNNWPIPNDAAEALFISIQSDTLGLVTESVTVDTFRVATELVGLGTKPATVENRRREFMKKPADILSYKAELINRINYHLDGRLATIHIPWEDIEAYSDRYNPSVLVLDEMRLVDTVEVAVAIKTYPDGKLTGKLRSNLPVAASVAGYFGGGGHDYSAGFKVYDEYQVIEKELISAVDKTLRDQS